MGIHQPPPYEMRSSTSIGLPSVVTAGSLEGPLHGWGSMTRMECQSRLMKGDLRGFEELSTRRVDQLCSLCGLFVRDL
jgi:hypothetical protein